MTVRFSAVWATIANYFAGMAWFFTVCACLLFPYFLTP